MESTSERTAATLSEPSSHRSPRPWLIALLAITVLVPALAGAQGERLRDRKGSSDAKGEERSRGDGEAAKPSADGKASERREAASQGDASKATGKADDVATPERRGDKGSLRGGDGRPSADGGSRSKASEIDLPEPNPAQQANLTKLRSDLATLGQGAANAEDEIRTLAHDLQGMAVTAPDPALVDALATDLQAALEDSDLSPREMAQLSQSIYGVLNSAGLDADELQVLKDDVESVLTASGVGRAEVQAVLRDLEAIYNSYQGGAQRGAPKTQRRDRSRSRGGSSPQ